MDREHYPSLDPALGDGRTDLEQSLPESINCRLADGWPTELHLLNGTTDKTAVFTIQRLQPVPYRFVPTSRPKEPHLENGRG